MLDGRWIITRYWDYERDKRDPKIAKLNLYSPNRKGVCSVDYDENRPLKRNQPDVYRFRIYDDDGVLYYEGLCHTDLGEEAFRPLDDFGTPDVGATWIAYWNGSEWEPL